MRIIRASCGALLAWAGLTGIAVAQPTIVASISTVVPGTAVTLTVNGPAGQHVAIIGSAVGAGFSYGGVALSVGTDVTIIALGVLDNAGVMAVGFTPPFRGTALDRFYVQAVTSALPNFAPLQASAGLVLRNRDLVASPPQKGSNSTTVSPALVAGVNFILATPAFVADSNATCHVSSSVQIDPSGPTPVAAGDTFGWMTNAVSRNGVAAGEVGVHGQYLVSIGTNGPQPGLTRASVIAVAAGETVQFGVRIAAVAGNAVGALAYVQTAYACW